MKEAFLKILQNSQENKCNVMEKEALVQIFPSEFCEVLKSNLFTEHLWASASAFTYSNACSTMFGICELKNELRGHDDAIF